MPIYEISGLDFIYRQVLSPEIDVNRFAANCGVHSDVDPVATRDGNQFGAQVAAEYMSFTVSLDTRMRPASERAVHMDIAIGHYLGT